MNHIQSLNFFLFNVLWMGWNTLLAIIPIIVARILQRTESRNIQGILFFVWLVFLPNTLYMITDVIHIFNPRFSQMTIPFWILGILLYMVVFFLAVFTFVLALRPVLQKYRTFLNNLPPSYKILLFSIISMLIGFAISMGRFQRTNTWYIVTQPIRVMRDVVYSLTDPTVLLVALFYSIGAYVIIHLSVRHNSSFEL